MTTPNPPFDADAARRLIEQFNVTGKPPPWFAHVRAITLLRAAVAEVDRLRERVKELEQSVERVAGDETASLNAASLSLPNLQVTRDLRDLRDSRDMT
jgi:hypothetical protein